MKKLLLALAILAAGLVAGAPADNCVNDLIVFRYDPTPYDCELDVSVNQLYEIDLVAQFGGHADPVDRLEFRIENWLLPGYSEGYATLEWLAGTPTGDLETGVTLSFDPPLDAGDGELLLARIQLMSFLPSWPPAPHEMSVQDPVVTDVHEQSFYTTRGYFTFNPTDWGYCMLAGDYEIFDVHAESISPPQGSTVAGVFNLDFLAVSWWCLMEEPQAFTGQILVDGEPAYAFEGTGPTPFIFPIDATGCGQGHTMLVEILLDGPDQSRAVMHYPVDECTGVEASSLSALKIRY